MPLSFSPVVYNQTLQLQGASGTLESWNVQIWALTPTRAPTFLLLVGIHDFSYYFFFWLTRVFNISLILLPVKTIGLILLVSIIFSNRIFQGLIICCT